MTLRLALVAALAATLSSVSATADDAAATALASGIDYSAMDRTVRPQDDLFRAVNGRWLATTDIPADRPRYGEFDRLAKEAEEHVRAILEEAAADARATGVRAKLGAYYRSLMDPALVAQAGVKPLAGELARIAAAKDAAEVVANMGRLQQLHIGQPVSTTVFGDRRDSRIYGTYVYQGGLGLPDRDYYLRDEDKYVETRAKYVAYVERLLALAGEDEAAGKAARILALETRLASNQWPRAETRDPVKTYNKMDIAAAGKLAHGVNWRGFLAAAGIDSGSMIVMQPSYFEGMAEALKDVPLADWKAYQTARLLNSFAPYLNEEFAQAEYEFNDKVLRDIPERRPRWRRAVGIVDGYMGEAVGEVYVARHFPPAAKARMDELVRNLLAAFDEGIDGLEWMTPATRTRAHEKLRKITVKIGYPEQWRDYSPLTINASDPIGNIIRGREFESRRIGSRAGKEVDRSEWLMTPQTVNAYYLPTANEIAFPAAILQPPFFNPAADDAVNYGAIGAVIGHEISHGFDDQGRKYDGDGNLSEWWTAEDDAAYQARAGKLGAQYDSYKPLPDLAINGKLSMGENIGDLSGLAVAYQAYQRSLDGKEAPVIDGYTGPQRFFLGFGQVWRTKQRESALRQQLLTGPHAPGEFRCNGVVTNMDEFYAAFDVREGDKLWRPAAERVKIW